MTKIDHSLQRRLCVVLSIAFVSEHVVFVHMFTRNEHVLFPTLTLGSAQAANEMSLCGLVPG